MRIVQGVAWSLGAAALLVLSACGGGSGSAPANNQTPVPTIATPASGATFRAGDTVAFAGSATDAEDGTIGASGLAWWAELHHDTHTHPFQPETSGASGSVDVPVRGETSANIFYRFHLRATDSAAAVTEVTRDITPQTSQFTLATVPTGLTLIDSAFRSGGAAFSSGCAVESVICALVQSSPVFCSIAAWYSTEMGSLSLPLARNLYCGRHAALLKR